jgi:hypothetical protein
MVALTIEQNASEGSKCSFATIPSSEQLDAALSRAVLKKLRWHDVVFLVAMMGE